MSKAILVIDMPETCYDCDIQCYCCNIDPENIKERRTHVSDNCPLRPMPERYGQAEHDAGLSWEEIEAYNAALDDVEAKQCSGS